MKRSEQLEKQKEAIINIHNLAIATMDLSISLAKNKEADEQRKEAMQMVTDCIVNSIEKVQRLIEASQPIPQDIETYKFKLVSPLDLRKEDLVNVFGNEYTQVDSIEYIFSKNECYIKQNGHLIIKGFDDIINILRK